MRPHRRPSLRFCQKCKDLMDNGYVPVPEHSNQDLPDDDTDDLKVFDRGKPIVVADLRRLLPTGRKDCLKQGRQVSDGEQDISKKSG